MWMLLLAPFVGSVLGVLIRRLPHGQPVAAARSRCETCHHVLGPADLVPVASFLLLRGRCRWCRAPIAAAHLAIELAALAVAGSAATVCAGPALWAACALGWTLLALAWIDWEHFWLPDVLVLPLLLAGLACTWALAPWALADHALAAAFGYAGLRLAGWLYAWRRGVEGIGQGDAKLLAAAGAWLGLLALPRVILLAALGGLLIAGGLRLAGRPVGRATALPFGTALAAATWLIFLAGAA
jgi:leader peptidase (prepilin peptidase)/N-methyltransferase